MRDIIFQIYCFSRASPINACYLHRVMLSLCCTNVGLHSHSLGRIGPGVQRNTRWANFLILFVATPRGFHMSVKPLSQIPEPSPPPVGLLTLSSSPVGIKEGITLL